MERWRRAEGCGQDGKLAEETEEERDVEYDALASRVGVHIWVKLNVQKPE